jgi:subtilisin family serine protease
MGKSTAEIKTTWIANFIRVKNANKAIVEALAAISGDFLIREPIVAEIIGPVESRNATEAEVKQALQWGVETIQCQQAWTKTRGAGAVVGIIDTGVHIMHEALADNFAGAWHDPYYNEARPTDQQSHGSHALGSAVGATNGIGVAPEAKWVACRGLNHQGSGYDAELLECAEWMVDGANPRPHVVSNSWGGGYNDPWYNSVVSAWKTANIIPVFALGNSGSSCGSAISPGDQSGLISVGATQVGDTMASFSSRGPGPAGSQKPEVSAPGANIVSAGNSGSSSYTVKSGTSMATPHVAGLVALLKSQNPDATYDEIYKKVIEAVDLPTLSNQDRQCGVPAGSDYPNMAFGYGRVNAAKAVGA